MLGSKTAPQSPEDRGDDQPTCVAAPTTKAADTTGTTPKERLHREHLGVRPLASDRFAVLNAAGIGELALDRLHHESLADRPDRRLHALGAAVLDDGDRLQVRLEGAALARRGLDADAAEVLRLAAILADPT